MAEKRRKRTWYKKKLRKRWARAARPWLFGLGALAIVVGLVAFASWSERSNEDRLALIAQQQQAPSQATAKPQPDKPSEEIVAVFFGDSYSQSQAKLSFPFLASKKLGWTPYVDALGGTGYTTANGELPPIPARVAPFLVPRDSVDVIVFAAGINDDPVTGIAAAASASWATARALHPEAEIIVVGPFSPGTPGISVTNVRNQIRTAAASAGLPFIDPLADQWLDGSYEKGTGTAAAYIGNDGTHPTAEGQEYLAGRFVDAYETIQP